MSTFDVDALQNSQFNESNSTTFTPIPEGEFKAVIDKFAFRTPKESVILDITWKFDDPAVTEATGIDNPTCRQSLFLDVLPSGGLDFGKGKNVSLGRLREALKQNNAGQAWGFPMLMGQVATVRTKQRSVRDEATGNDSIFTDVVAVIPLK